MISTIQTMLSAYTANTGLWDTGYPSISKIITISIIIYIAVIIIAIIIVAAIIKAAINYAAQRTAQEIRRYNGELARAIAYELKEQFNQQSTQSDQQDPSTYQPTEPTD